MQFGQVQTGAPVPGEERVQIVRAPGEERVLLEKFVVRQGPLNTLEKQRVAKILAALPVSRCAQGVCPPPGNPQMLMLDQGFMPFRYTERDIENVEAKQRAARHALQAQTFAQKVISEIVALQNIGAAPMQFGEYDIEKPTTVRMPVAVGEPLTVEYATGQAPVEPAPEKPPVNWINIAMLGVPLLRLFTRR
jgi:hypothetical protein